MRDKDRIEKYCPKCGNVTEHQNGRCVHCDYDHTEE